MSWYICTLIIESCSLACGNIYVNKHEHKFPFILKILLKFVSNHAKLSNIHTMLDFTCGYYKSENYF
jgi:hypothetical protein